MTSNGDDDWAAYTKGVKPISAVKNLAKKSKASSKPRSPHSIPPRKGEGIPPRLRQIDFTSPIDRNIEKRLRQGVVGIDARIDLHGMRQDEAHQALEDFLGRNVKAGARCLLIITGKGRGNEGVLRSNLGKWLSASHHARHILALRPAAIKHGGDGAFYVMLRRKTKNELK